MFQDGDVIAFDYDLYVEGRDAPYDTTRRETAEKAGVLDAEAFYAPMWYLFGVGRIIKGLEEGLRAMSVGESKTLEIGPEDAYGSRDPKLVETLPIQEFRRAKIDPQPGMVITHKNRRGIVQFVGGSRIRVDFNHALAGKRLKYLVTVPVAAKNLEEKVKGIIQMDYPTPLTWEVTAKAGVASIHVPDQAKFDQRFLVAKYRFLADLRLLSELKEARIVEVYPLKEAEAATAKVTRAPEATPAAKAG